MKARKTGILHEWNRVTAYQFTVSVAGLNLLLSVIGSFGPQVQVSIPKLHLSVGSKFVLLMAATLLPAAFCFVCFKETRSSLGHLKTSWSAYILAITIGLILPFTSYFGSHYPDLSSDRSLGLTMIRVFVLNIFLTPLWEEVIWRGCFYRRLLSFTSRTHAILLSSLGWTVWHFGFLAYLYGERVPTKVLAILPLQYFCSGVILAIVFEKARYSLLPCILLHAGFNTSTLVYYRSFDRVSELSSYISELIFCVITSCVLLWTAARRKVPGPNLSEPVLPS